MLIGINDVGHEFVHKNGVDEERFDAFYKCSDLTPNYPARKSGNNFFPGIYSLQQIDRNQFP